MGRPDRLHDEAGNSPVTVVAGVLIFLGFLLLAAQTTIHLYGVSTSTAVLYDEARRVATSPANGYPCSAAIDSARSRLGGWGDRLDLRCAGDDDPTASQVTLTLTGQSPANLLSAFGNATGLATLHRTATVQREEVQP